MLVISLCKKQQKNVITIAIGMSFFRRANYFFKKSSLYMYFQVKNTLKNNCYHNIKHALIILRIQISCQIMRKYLFKVGIKTKTKKPKTYMFTIILELYKSKDKLCYYYNR